MVRELVDPVWMNDNFTTGDVQETRLQNGDLYIYHVRWCFFTSIYVDSSSTQSQNSVEN